MRCFYITESCFCFAFLGKFAFLLQKATLPDHRLFMVSCMIFAVRFNNLIFSIAEKATLPNQKATLPNQKATLPDLGFITLCHKVFFWTKGIF